MIQRRIISLAFVLSLLAGVALGPMAHAATFGDDKSNALDCSSSFLGFPAWFDGLPRKNGTCELMLTEDADTAKVGQSNLTVFIFRIVLNIIEIALRLIGFAAVGFIIYGGFKYLTSAGAADRIASGRKIIQNALIGLVLSFFSVAIVNLIADNIH